MKYKEIVKYFAIAGIGINLLFSEPMSTYAAQLTDEVSVVEEVSTKFNASDFVIENGVLKDYTGNAAKIVIPSGVTSIGEEAFYKCDNLVSVTMSSGIKSIGASAFKDCVELEEVIFSDTIESIGSRAFDNCELLKEIILPKSVKTIGQYAFCNCYDVEKIVIQEGVTSIGYHAFEDCDQVEKLELPGTISSMGEGVFWHCSKLTKVTIKNGADTIGTCAFQDCTELEEVSIPGSITTIGEKSFSGCTNLTKATIGDGVKNINSRAFDNCELLKEIILPKSVKTIGQYAFCNCYDAEKIVIQEGVTSIGYHAFEDCDQVEKLELPGTISSMGEGVFYHCSSLKKVTIQEGADTIGTYAFKECEKLEEVNIPGSVTTIGEYSFSDCSELKKVAIGNGVKNIGTRTFQNCKKLEEIILPESVKTIGNYAFYNCSSLVKAVILDKITSIGSNTFDYTPDKFTIYGIENSYAHEYAKTKEIPFQVLKATITTQPKSVSIAEGKTTSFTVKATGVDLQYQWQYCPSGSSTWSNSSESGSKTDTLNIEGTQSKNGYKYRCIVIDGMGNKVTSSSATLTVTANKPTAVSGLKIGGRATDALRLNWNKNSNASGYIIEQYKNGKWTRIARIGSNSTTTYRVEKLSTSTTYKFRVQSFNLNGSTANYSDWQYINGKTLPTTVSGLKIGGRATDALRLNWSKNSNASGYIIEQYKDGKWTRIAKIENNSTTTYRVEKLSTSTTYKFRVQSYNFDGSTPLYSSWKNIEGTTLPTTVSSLKIGGRATDALRLNWNKNEKASGYIIEQYKNGKWMRIARIGSNSTTTYRVEGLSASASYKFRVQSFGFDGNTAIYSGWKNIDGKTLPTTVSGLKIGGWAKDALRLNWDKNSNASGYIIEQYKNGKWTRIARIGSNSTTTYRVEKLSSSTTYKFRVQSFGFDGNTAIYSGWQYVNGTTK